MPKAIIVSGEPGTAGHIYRVDRLRDALHSLGYEVQVWDAQRLPHALPDGFGIDVAWLWRAVHTPEIEAFVGTCRARGASILYDLDDLMFEPELATEETIDAIRSGNYRAREVAAHYQRIRRAMLLADTLTAPTRPLALAMRKHFRPVFVIPNTFDHSILVHSVEARAGISREKCGGGRDIVRIGYASGTLTHQKDFRMASTAVAACLRANPHVRLVLFRRQGVDLLNLREFPEFNGLDGQIEWREFVGLEGLPGEMARFNINIAPLEFGNRYVEAKSELKYFDAALVRVPTVASPTEPFATAIAHGVNGYLAESHSEWREILQQLVDDDGLRSRIGEMAWRHAIAKHGPFTKVHSVRRCLLATRGSASEKAFATCAEISAQQRKWNSPVCAESEKVFSWLSGRAPRLTVAVPVFNYASLVREALESVKAQTLEALELVVVDDASTDNSLREVLDWVEAHKRRFTRVAVFSNKSNSGLGMTRNLAFAEAESLFVLPLDADNKLKPDCSERLLAALEGSPAAFAYPLIQHFGESVAQMGYLPWNPMLLPCGNFIDAMTLVNKSAWSEVGGYDPERSGWEDYGFWCRLVEAGYWGLQVPAALAFYRVHGRSMLRNFTEEKARRVDIARRFREKHPWLDIPGY